jgi:GTP-binding protein
LKFIDFARVFFQAGKGGAGCFAFEKYGKKATASGGNGGKGGDIILVGNSSINHLTWLKFHPHQKASDGVAGRGKNQNGAGGADKHIEVPLGTIIWNQEQTQIILEVLEEKEYLLLKGTAGGRGNQNSRRGVFNEELLLSEPPQEVSFYLELKVIADIGLVGLPNAGKSSFISKVSNQKAKIADYPFTTLHPALGVVSVGDYQSLVIADIPGLIEGANQGKGLGHRFLKHIQRTKILFFFIDISMQNPQGARETFALLEKELTLFSKDLLLKQKIVILNKQDVMKEAGILEKEKNYFQKKKIPVYLISCKTGYGIKELLGKIKYLKEK